VGKYVACNGAMRNAYVIVGKPEEKTLLGDLNMYTILED
jgi:hypothetical protein